MSKKILIPTILISIVALIAGCGGGGGSSSAEQEARDTIVSSVTAYKNKDWAKFCSILSSSSKNKMSTMIKQYSKKNLNCEQAYAFMFKSNPASGMSEKDFQETLKKIKAAKITIEPDSKKLTINLAKGQPVFLVKENGQWKLSDS